MTEEDYWDEVCAEHRAAREAEERRYAESEEESDDPTAGFLFECGWDHSAYGKGSE